MGEFSSVPAGRAEADEEELEPQGKILLALDSFAEEEGLSAREEDGFTTSEKGEGFGGELAAARFANTGAQKSAHEARGVGGRGEGLTGQGHQGEEILASNKRQGDVLEEGLSLRNLGHKGLDGGQHLLGGQQDSLGD